VGDSTLDGWLFMFRDAEEQLVLALALALAVAVERAARESPDGTADVEAYEGHREDVHSAEGVLTEAMRADVRRNPAEDDTPK
jgi:hypothetical protein